MIFHENGVFHLQTDHYSYLFRVNRLGLVEHLHFGAPVQTRDAEGFACRPGLGWGSSVLLDDADPGSCMDALPLEWSGAGRGDYRETPLQIEGSPTDLRYVSHEILDGAAPMSLPQAKDASQTLVITLEQKGLRLRLYYTVFETALTRRVVLENTGAAPIRLTKIMSQCVDLPGSYEMTTFNGGWIAEMGKHTVPVLGSRIVNESTTGASSNRHNPGFLLSEPGAGEDHGRVYGFNLVYSGNHYGSAQRSVQGLTRVMQGISGDHFGVQLAPEATFETPEAVLWWSDQGFNGLSKRMHDFVNEHIVPKYWRFRHRPVLYNNWEGCMFDFDQHRLLGLAKKARALGCELFVLDDGWFGNRNNDKAGLGDYTVNKKKLPGGLEGLSARVRKMGMEFGLWFEPESVNVDSQLYRAHPDWVLADELEPVMGRHQLLLDLTKPAVRDYIVQNVSDILDRARISYVKWDMNRHSVALGEKAHRYVLGLYEVLERIFGPRPQILLETCSSGGNRFDLGMLCFGPQIWCSDNTDPISRLDIQGGLSYLYPQSTFGAHVSAAPHAQTLRTTPLTTRGNVSFFGVLGYELDLKHLLQVEVKEIREQIRLYKQYRKLLQFGTFRRSENGWQVSNGQTVIAGVFHKAMDAAPGYEQLRIPGLSQKRPYRVCSRTQGLRIGQFGALVKHVAPVELNPHGLILRTADRMATLPDGVQEAVVSGSALGAGLMLYPLFRGTGYDRDQRTQLDFGSNLYIVEAEE
jgi:alpha-galactosidase